MPPSPVICGCPSGSSPAATAGSWAGASKLVSSHCYYCKASALPSDRWRRESPVRSVVTSISPSTALSWSRTILSSAPNLARSVLSSFDCAVSMQQVGIVLACFLMGQSAHMAACHRFLPACSTFTILSGWSSSKSVGMVGRGCPRNNYAPGAPPLGPSPGASPPFPGLAAPYYC